MLSPSVVLLGDEEIFKGKVYDLGSISLNEFEIMRFAQTYDPLWLHTDPEAASKGPWKRIIGSGPMLFSEFHRRFWIPRFGPTVIGGIGIHNWEFLRPHFPDVSIRGILKVAEIKFRDNNSAAVKWDYHFHEQNFELMQTVEFTVLHSSGGFKWINQTEG